MSLLSLKLLITYGKMPVLKKRKTDGIAGGAGLIRYFDVDEGGPKMDPKLVVGIVVAMIILELLASIMFS